MKRFLAALAALVLASTAADAATYHVRPGGVDTNSGASYAAAWRTISKANTAARPGDLIYVYNGTYAHFPNPDSAGSNPTGGGRITFVGANQSADPLTSRTARDAIALPSGTASKSYVTIKGMKIGGYFTIGSSTNWDSIRSCTIAGGLQIDGDYNVISLSDCEGTSFQMGRNALKTAGNVIENSNFPNLGRGVTGNPLSLWVVGNSECPTGVYHIVDSTRFDRLQRTFTIEAGLGDAHPQVFYKARNTSQNYCRTHFDNQRTSRTSYVYRLRDSSQVVSFNADTITTSGVGSFEMFMNSNGNNECPGRGNSVARVVVDSSYWNLAGGTGGSEVLWQESMNDFTMSYSTVVTRGPALMAYHLRGRSSITNSTLVGRGQAGGGYAGVIRFVKEQFPAWGDTALTFRNNIVYSIEGETAPDAGSPSCAALFLAAAIDSGTKTHQQNNLVSQSNVYWYKGYTSSAGDRSLSDYATKSRPGDNTAWDVKYRTDSLSVYECPVFADSTPATFMPALQRALSITAGAVAYVNQGQLTVVPSEARFTTGIPDSVVFSITNTGDESVAFDWNGEKIGAQVQFGITTSERLIEVAAGATYSFKVYYDGTFGPLAPFNVDLYTLPPANCSDVYPQPANVTGLICTGPFGATNLPILAPDPSAVQHLAAGAVYHTLRIPVFVE